jgi:hypothetical protein
MRNLVGQRDGGSEETGASVEETCADNQPGEAADPITCVHYTRNRVHTECLFRCDSGTTSVHDYVHGQAPLLTRTVADNCGNAHRGAAWRHGRPAAAEVERAPGHPATAARAAPRDARPAGGCPSLAGEVRPQPRAAAGSTRGPRCRSRLPSAARLAAWTGAVHQAVPVGVVAASEQLATRATVGVRQLSGATRREMPRQRPRRSRLVELAFGADDDTPAQAAGTREPGHSGATGALLLTSLAAGSCGARLKNPCNSSSGSGKIIVEFFSAAISVSV